MTTPRNDNYNNAWINKVAAWLDHNQGWAIFAFCGTVVAILLGIRFLFSILGVV